MNELHGNKARRTLRKVGPAGLSSLNTFRGALA